jgi:hypothetical protein
MAERKSSRAYLLLSFARAILEQFGGGGSSSSLQQLSSNALVRTVAACYSAA